MSTRRNFPLSLFLTLIAPSLGHIYHGFWVRGFVILTIFTMYEIFELPIYNIYKLLAFPILLLIVFADLVWVRAKTNDKLFKITKYNKWYIYILICAISQLPGLLRHDKTGSIFREIISDSMVPTILRHENVIIEQKFNTIERGDIVFFISADGKDTIKRVVANPGDTIEIKNKVVYINGKMINNQILELSDTSFLKIDKKYEGKNWNFFKSQSGEKKHLIMISDDIKFYNKDVPLTKIPTGKYFLMGDNRDFSFDSREREFGLLPYSEIKGKVIFIYSFTNLKSFRKAI